MSLVDLTTQSFSTDLAALQTFGRIGYSAGLELELFSSDAFADYTRHRVHVDAVLSLQTTRGVARTALGIAGVALASSAASGRTNAQPASGATVTVDASAGALARAVALSTGSAKVTLHSRGMTRAKAIEADTVTAIQHGAKT
jgi:hypothetical protein